MMSKIKYITLYIYRRIKAQTRWGLVIYFCGFYDNFNVKFFEKAGFILTKKDDFFKDIQCNNKLSPMYIDLFWQPKLVKY